MEVMVDMGDMAGTEEAGGETTEDTEDLPRQGETTGGITGTEEARTEASAGGRSSRTGTGTLPMTNISNVVTLRCLMSSPTNYI